VSYCLAASCLAHRERVFWHPEFGQWVHTNCYPCDALAGQADPTELRCRYCGARVETDGPDRLVSYVPEAAGTWVRQPDGRLFWHRDPWLPKCPISPTFHHEVTRMRFTEVKQAG
jgi:hypothetical protein